jgi:hypothetical protein
MSNKCALPLSHAARAHSDQWCDSVPTLQHSHPLRRVGRELVNHLAALDHALPLYLLVQCKPMLKLDESSWRGGGMGWLRKGTYGPSLSVVVKSVKPYDPAV